MELAGKFEEIYGASDNLRTYLSPGRVNLIGEHTDYNGGYVFPCALDIGTHGIARKRDDGIIRLTSINYGMKVELKADDVEYKTEHGWANYLKGIIKEFQGLDAEKITGLELLISGNIPSGAGLSSSASIELLMCAVLSDLFDYDIAMIDMVKLSQRVENEFVGVNCGIMDQFVVGMGKKNHALLLKCDTLDYEYVPLDLEGCKLVIANTNKKRELADSKYNERRSECERALEFLNEKMSISCLGELSVEEFNSNRSLIKDETCAKRAEHVVKEDGRVTESVKKLMEGDIAGFGKLMNESHESLRDLYEVTGYELDTLVELAWSQNGVLGSRMTGAGFGGCTVSIVKKDSVESFIKNISEKYRQKTGLKAEFYLAETGDGAMRIE